MFLWIFLCTLAVGLLSCIYTYKSMRPVDKISLMMNLMLKTGYMTFMAETGLNKRMRPKLTETTLPNGIRIKAPGGLIRASCGPVLSLKTRNDDVFLATYPKAGTTWIQEIAWLICNDADLAAAKQESLIVRSPFLEAFDIGDSVKGLQSIEKWPADKQRIIKTHLPYELLPEEVTSGRKSKIVCVARNPKDVCVSYYHFHRMNYGMPEPGTWNEFYTKFCSGDVGWGSWFPHTLKYWKEHQKDKSRIYFTTYEALKKDLRSEVSSIAKFLHKNLTDEQITAITEHCTFDNMSKNKQTNYSKVKKFGLDFKMSKFMRKGQVGDWKNYFTLNQSAEFDEMYEEKMKGMGLAIPFEL